MSNYITLARAKDALRSSYDGSDDNVLADVLQSCCAFVDTYCNRSPGGFVTTSYDRLIHGTGTNQLYLPDAPIQTIARISTYKTPSIYVRNDDSDPATIATMSITSTSMILTYLNGLVNGAQPTVTTLNFGTYLSIKTLVAAINAVGNGWQAGDMSGLGDRPTSDLYFPQGSYGARVTTCYGWTFYYQLPVFTFDPNDSMGEVFSEMGFSRGVFNYRFQFTAGYTSLPNDLAQAICELVAHVYYAREANSNMQTESLGPQSYTRLTENGFGGMSAVAKQALNRYKIHRISKFSTW